MIIKSLTLHNIRSYKDHKPIKFSVGSMLFQGDVGSGKSTILSAIEFALFGLGDIDGRHLLRGRENEGWVLLEFEVDGKEYKVFRSLVRRRKYVHQGEGYIIENDVRTDYSVSEMKERILDILDFNERPQPKTSSLIFRYAVFTPQEMMKEVLFQSVDLRIVAAKPEDQWMNVITSLFLSSKSQEEIKSEQQQARDKLPNTDKFRILLTCYPFESLPRLFTHFNKGEIKVGIPIKFRESYPSELRVEQFLPSYLKEMKEWKLVGSEARGQQEDRKNLWPIVESQNGTARLLGYENIYELIRETLRIRDFVGGRLRDFVIGVPIAARIANLSLVRSSATIKTKKVFGLENLQLNLYHKRYNSRIGYETIWRKTELVKKCKRPPAHKFCHVTNSIQLTDLRPYDMIEVELIHKQVPTLGLDETRLHAPLENVTEPFAKALNSFCSLEIFRERLLDPERCVEGRTRPNTIFENAVAWLLSLVGFSILPLGRRFERLKILETGYEVGSVDIIAYRENECLLLVDCDTSIPDDKKIRSMRTVKDHFRFLQDEYRRPKII